MFFLSRKILFKVVDDQGALQGSPQPRQILDESTFYLRCVLSVEPVLDQVLARVQLVEDKVGVCLVGRRENHNLVQLCHISKELDTERPHLVDHLSMLKMDQGLIQVQD